jgi:hypothetical protein
MRNNANKMPGIPNGSSMVRMVPNNIVQKMAHNSAKMEVFMFNL